VVDRSFRVVNASHFTRRFISLILALKQGMPVLKKCVIIMVLGIYVVASEATLLISLTFRLAQFPQSHTCEGLSCEQYKQR
jgi:hypothetical protein